VGRRDRPLRGDAARAAITSSTGIDPDLDADDQPSSVDRHRDGGALRSIWPSIHWCAVAFIGIGGFAGGLSRYGIDRAWVSASGSFPWATLVINTSGAFALALLLALALERFPANRYLRPALGTGFCGAYTTFSSVTVSTDQLAAHGHAMVAAIYVLTSLLAGLAAALVGILIGRSLGARGARPA
jgi:CrcB protein